MLYIHMAGPSFVSDDSFLSPRDEVSGLAVISSLLVGSYLQMRCYYKHIFIKKLQAAATAIEACGRFSVVARSVPSPD